MKYEIKVHLTLEAATRQQALENAAACVSNADTFEAGKLSGVGLARGYVSCVGEDEE